jgi:GT2 family glycosyltransferase
MKIAISLITYNDLELLKPCLESLFVSDLNQHEFKLFVCDNGSNTQMIEYISNLDVNKYIIFNLNNEGIVIPRIKIYKEIIKENFDYLLEIHSDMLFPKVWLKQLFDIDDDKTIILEPHIFQPSQRITAEIFESYLNRLVYDKTYYMCRQIHPWLIKLKLVDTIGGYYDEIFSPQQFEDDDFTYRVAVNGFNIKSTGKSWVCHYGGLTRNVSLPSFKEQHLQLFEKKHNILFLDAIKLYEYHPTWRNFK